jgi:hypothetical protein
VKLAKEHGIAALLTLSSLLYIPWIISGASMPRWWVLAIAAPLVADPRLISFSARFLLAASLIWAAAISGLRSPHPHAAAFEVYLLAVLILLAFAGAGLPSLRRALTALGWGVGLSSLIALAQVLGLPRLPADGFDGFRGTGLFLNAEVFGLTVAPLAVWAAIERRKALAAVLFLGLLLSGSRLALACGALSLAAAVPGGLRPKLAALGILAALAVLLALFTRPDFVVLTWPGTRLVLWLTAARSILPFGRGMGWWAAAHPSPYEEFVHSDLLQAMIELGVVGAIPLVVFFVTAFANSTGRGDHACRSALLVLLLEACVSFPLHAPVSAALAFLLAGHLLRARARVSYSRSASGNRDFEDCGRESSFAGRGYDGHRPGGLVLPV